MNKFKVKKSVKPGVRLKNFIFKTVDNYGIYRDNDDLPNFSTISTFFTKPRNY